MPAVGSVWLTSNVSQFVWNLGFRKEEAMEDDHHHSDKMRLFLAVAYLYSEKKA